MWDRFILREAFDNVQVKPRAGAALCNAIDSFQWYGHISPTLSNTVVVRDVALMSWDSSNKYNVDANESIWKDADG